MKCFLFSHLLTSPFFHLMYRQHQHFLSHILPHFLFFFFIFFIKNIFYGVKNALKDFLFYRLPQGI